MGIVLGKRRGGVDEAPAAERGPSAAGMITARTGTPPGRRQKGLGPAGG